MRRHGGAIRILSLYLLIYCWISLVNELVSEVISIIKGLTINRRRNSEINDIMKSNKLHETPDRIPETNEKKERNPRSWKRKETHEMKTPIKRE